MKYVVRMIDGFYKAKNKKDAIEFLNETDNTVDIIKTRAINGNYWHNKVNVVACK